VREVSAQLLDEIRQAAARVMTLAQSVRIDRDALLVLAESLADSPPPAAIDPAHHYLGEPRDTVAFILTLDAINFGSGYFPYLKKRPGCSGYLTIATALKEHFEKNGPWEASELTVLSPQDCASCFGQDLDVPEVFELMSLFSQALGDLGIFLTKNFNAEFPGPVIAAEHSAARLVGILSKMPLYRDVSQYRGFEVPFYKRAQLTAADLAAVFKGEGYGAFTDLDQLTLFADNLVPHVLRREGVLIYHDELATRIENGHRLEAGSLEEVEIRAGAVEAVERCVEWIRDSGLKTSAAELDLVLWTRGQSPEVKAHPRHRARTTNY
jgi:hypothetical protein